MSLFMRHLQPFRSGLSVIASRLLVTERLVRAQFSPVISVQCKPSLPENEFLILSSGEVVPICGTNHCAVPLWRSGAQGVPTQEPAARAAGASAGGCGQSKGLGLPLQDTTARSQLHRRHKWALRWCSCQHWWCFVVALSMHGPFTAETCVSPILQDAEAPSAEQLCSALAFYQVKEEAAGWEEWNSSVRFRPHPSYQWSYDAFWKALVCPWGTEAEWDHISTS